MFLSIENRPWMASGKVREGEQGKEQGMGRAWQTHPGANDQMLEDKSCLIIQLMEPEQP